MTKKLYRSENNKMVAGVLAGLAGYFDQDATIWRLLFVFFLLITGFFPGVIMYILAWILIPLKSNGPDYVIHE